jgi:hypothetical protein
MFIDANTDSNKIRNEFDNEIIYNNSYLNKN